MKIAAQIIGYPIYGILYAGLVLLAGLYFVDFMHELFTDFRFMMIVVIVLGSLIFTFIYWGAMLAMSPLKAAIDESSETGKRIAGLALTPFGLVAGFFLWQIQNWLFFGVFDIDPWAYNGVFRHLDLVV